MEKQEPNALPSSSQRSLSSAPHLEIKEVPVGIETHEEIQRGVPEFGGKATSGEERTQHSAEEENKRQERLLRNKISQKKYREYRKDYLFELEKRVKHYEKQKYELEMMLSHVQYENQMLRQCLLEKNKAKDLENRLKDLGNRAKDLENKKSELEEDVYLSDLEKIAKEMEKLQSEFEETLSNVEKENQMLKDSLMNSTRQMRGAGGSNADSGL